MHAIRPLAIAATCAAALLVAACGGATSTSAPGAAGTDGKGADAFPASTILFVDANADVNSSAWQKVLTVAKRFPGFPKVQAQVQQELTTTEHGGSFAQDVQPWLGDEAAVGLLAITLSGGKPKPQYAVFLASKDDAKATVTISKDATKGADYRGYATFTASSDPHQQAAVGKGAVLIADGETSLHAAIDAREGSAADRLSGVDRYGEALKTLPDDNVLVGYVDGPKLAQLAGTAFAAASQQAGRTMIPPAQVDQALTQLEAIRAIAFSAGADDGGFRLHASTLLDAAKAKDLKLPAAAPLQLLDRAPADALVFAGVPGLGQLGEALQNLKSNPQVGQAVSMAEAATGLSLEQDVLPLLSGEVGAYVAGGAPASGAVLLLPKDANAAAASLPRITAAIGKVGGEDAPTFAPLPSGDGQIADVGGGHQVSWLHDGDLIAIGVDTGGKPPAGGLGATDRFKDVAGAAKLPGDVTGLLYADVPGLVDLAQRTSGKQVPAEALANVRALGGVLAWATGDENVAHADLYVQVPAQ
jgi:hypothetical protein